MSLSYFNRFMSMLALVLFLMVAACTGQPLTHENGGPAPEKPNPNPTCTCVKGDVYQINANNPTELAHRVQDGTCDAWATCNYAVGTPYTCASGWQDTVGTNGWYPLDGGRFHCLGSEATCKVTGCQSDYLCNEATGKCEPKEFFDCKTMTCTQGSLVCDCQNATTAICWQAQGQCYLKGGVEACAIAAGDYGTPTSCGNGNVCSDGKCVSGTQTGCTVTGCASGQACNASTGVCYSTGGGQTTPGYDHTFCAWASVTAKGAYGGQTNTLDATSTKDWTDMSDSKDMGGWYPVISGGQTKFCRGVTSLARGIRVLIQTADGDFPGWVKTTTGKQYQLPFTIYGSWDNGSYQGSVTPSSQDCISGEVNKATCQLNKGTLTGVYGAVFPTPWGNQLP